MEKNYFYLLFFVCSFIYAQPGSESAITTINATIPYQGVGEPTPLLGSGQYKIYYDNVDGVLDKPIFFVDGFDPNDSRDIPLMYSLLNFGDPVMNLGDLIRDEGFDLVVLNFEASYLSPTDGTTEILGGADYIQRNAFTMVELINTINGMKTGTEQNVVIGPSMGGLISRYALRYMEQNSLDHDTRLYISFDAPHRGANVPIGIQYLFNYMVNGDPGITEAEPLVSGLLNSAAAKQMLIDHYLGHVDAGGVEQDNSTHTPKGAPNFRNAFQTELDAMGFPQNVRNVAITNGSGTGQMSGSPGLQLINHTFDTGTVAFPPFGNINTRAIITVHFTPAAGQNIEVTDFVGQGFLFGSWFNVFTYEADAQSLATSDGLDSAPGGQFDLYSFDDGTNPLITEFVSNLNSQYFDFIPTLSGLAISNEPNWYATPNVSNSPFANTYIPDDNEPHVTLTQGNVAFALDEILNPTLGVIEQPINDFIKIERNPISNEFTLINSTQINNALIHIVDMTGKQVLSTQTSISERTSVPVNLESGLYILNISSENGLIFKTKLIVK
ncbi:T9SS type A sorting domain-containing protein [Subsaxibacter sp. CAU 1640]|uniref:T9SS type A sorting domain-containing protein n=1 Tax=Subsaxibacter sp. CAU 1640 TaxID=2933271 RepID=UPI002006027B|nr:T9SS type A sorting domain-containing protein [Subsaxibacter sp. CAU 1640]MCK7590197.1 T9SS type A sorting domain-containing protein [Subsaxibacter sp. CAU 1640]